MTLYNNFIGIDIGKKCFFVNLYGKKNAVEYDNTPQGIEQFLKAYQAKLSQAFCVLEATGGYEMRLLLTLVDQHIVTHRANARKVKHFIRSYGNGAKTDALDAKALARYAYERHSELKGFTPASTQTLKLYELVQRRNDLKQMLVAEKNRQSAPKTHYVQSSLDQMIALLTQQLDEINQAIDQLIDGDDTLCKKRQVLMSVPGIGKKVAAELLAMMPELGQMTRRQAAALAGVAPRANESGQFKGYRRTAPGRNLIKPMLFLAAMAARNSSSSLKAFYERLVAKGKCKMVALVAVMRKIIVIANARLKALDNTLSQEVSE